MIAFARARFSTFIAARLDRCVCGHVADEEHSSFVDDGPYGDMCLFCACDRGRFAASISGHPPLHRLVLAIVHVVREAWCLRIDKPLDHLLHDCGSTFGCRRCSTIAYADSAWYRRGQIWRGRGSQFVLGFYQSHDNPNRGFHRMRLLKPSDGRR